MIHEGSVLITSANMTCTYATKHSWRMLMKALCSSHQNKHSSRCVGWICLFHGVTHNGIDLDRKQIDFNLHPRIWALRWCLPQPQLLAATASTHP